MNKPKIAILGSTSHIAKGLINNFLQSEEFILHLYTRSPDKMNIFLNSIGKLSDKYYKINYGYSNFDSCRYESVINCVGIGTLNKFNGDFSKYFLVNEQYDNMIIDYLLKYPDTLYVSLSSGVVYGREYSSPAEENTINNIKVNHIDKEDYYTIVKLNSETKHRAFNRLNIVDLRIFSYFSRFIDLTDGYFITEVINHILNQKVFVTDNNNIVRDYIHPEDLFSIIRKCIDNRNINVAFDVISAKPVEKREILDYFSLEYGLKYEISQSLNYASATGSKNIYYSKYNKALEIGYKPKFSSIDTIKQESRYILKGIK